MEPILNLIGKEARRVTFRIQSDNNYYMLFSVIELLQPDMQDFNDYRGEGENISIDRKRPIRLNRIMYI